jgi:hypothetical protein
MIRMVMLRHIVIGRRRLRIVVLHRVLVVLHRVLVVLVLEALRGVLLLQIHRRCSCCFVAWLPLHHQELLVL